jgi:hypothetical protein
MASFLGHKNDIWVAATWLVKENMPSLKIVERVGRGYELGCTLLKRFFPLNSPEKNTRKSMKLSRIEWATSE